MRWIARMINFILAIFIYNKNKRKEITYVFINIKTNKHI